MEISVKKFTTLYVLKQRIQVCLNNLKKVLFPYRAIKRPPSPKPHLRLTKAAGSQRM